MTDRTPPGAEEETLGAASTEMHDHFHQNRVYRAEDLQRVLGDPRDHVKVQNSDSGAP
jgi:hypothetical protein